MPKLQLFEVEWNVRDGSNIIDFPSNLPFLLCKENRSEIKGNKAQIFVWFFAGTSTPSSTAGHSIFLNLSVAVKRVGDSFLPEDGVQTQTLGKIIIEKNVNPRGPASNVDMVFKSGAFNFEKDLFPDLGVITKNGRVTFHFQDLDVTPSADVPISTSIPPRKDASKGFYFDFREMAERRDKPAVVFLASSFVTQVVTKFNVPRLGIKNFSQEELFSEETIFLLDVPLDPARVTFVPKDNDEPLLLHSDLYSPEENYSAEGNPLICPIEVESYKLELQFSPRGPDGTKISGVTVKPTIVDGKEAFLLRNFTYADTHNQAVELYIKNELDLHLRVGVQNRPTTLLIAPDYTAIGLLPTELRSAGDVHGFVKNSKYKLASKGLLMCDRRRETPATGPNSPGNTPWIDPSIASEITAPWFSFETNTPKTGNTFLHEKPGEIYVREGTINSDLQAVDTFSFTGPTLGLPALSSHLFNRNTEYVTLEEEQLTHINQQCSAKLGDTVQAIRHETLLEESPASNPNINLNAIFQHKSAPELEDPNSSARVQEVKIAAYEVIRNYGPVKLSIKIDPKVNRDYFVLKSDSEIAGYNLGLDTKRYFSVKGHPKGVGPKLPLGILKLSNRFGLEEILTKEGFDVASITKILDSDVKSQGWLGLILFKVPVAPDETTEASRILRSVVPSTGLFLEYVAITPEKNFGTGDPEKLPYSVNARITWNADKDRPDGSPASEREGETFFALKKLDVFWRDSQLNSFDAEADVSFKSFLSIRKESGVRILGTYDKPRDTIRFIGQLNNPISLLPDSVTAGPVKQVSVKSAEIVYSRGKVAISIDGKIDFQEFSVFKLAEDSSVDFDNLQIILPENAGDGTPKWLGIGYPSLKLKFNLPPFRLGFLSLKFNGLGIRWDGTDFNTQGLRGVSGHDTTDLGSLFLFLDLRLELMKMPELATGVIDKLTFDFFAGISPAGDRLNFDLSKLKIWLKAVAFENLDIDLMRFLRIKVEKVQFEQRQLQLPAGGIEEVTWIKFVGVKVVILDNTIVNDLTVFIFSARGNRRGFVAYYASEDKPKSESKLVALHWILIGNNIALEANLAKQIIEVERPGSTQALQKRIKESVDKDEILAAPADSRQGNWIFAASFTVLGDLLDGKFLFQDKSYYGICLGGGIFEKWFGYKFAISVLYIKATDPAQDTFVVSIAVPFVATSSFSFMGGVITIEIVMNGGFTLDVGFPHLLPNGSRQWNRTFGAIMSPYQGSGGFYIQKRAYSFQLDEKNPAPGVKPKSALVLIGGYAVQGGLGTSFGGSVYRVWVTAGFYYILEGKVLLCDGDVRGLSLVGANGILVRGSGELNWWIISIRVEITLSAESRVTLIWGNHIPEPPEQFSDALCTTFSNKAVLRLDFTLYANVEAEACIGGGWFKVCKSISVSLPMHFGFEIKFN